jgi:hypothetical protein
MEYIASLEDVEPAVVVRAGLRLPMTGWTRRRAQRARASGNWPTTTKRHVDPSKPLDHSVSLAEPDTMTLGEWRRWRGLAG